MLKCSERGVRSPFRSTRGKADARPMTSQPAKTEATPTLQTAAEFLALAGRSRLLDGDRVQLLTAKLHRRSTAEDIAQQLIRDGELTPFQAKKLLGGQWQGLVVGRFRILKPIGRGGMGVVYLAEDTVPQAKRV